MELSSPMVGEKLCANAAVPKRAGIMESRRREDNFIIKYTAGISGVESPGLLAVPCVAKITVLERKSPFLFLNKLCLN